MSQQHAQFEEEFRDGPQPHVSYHENYIEQPSIPYTPPAPPSMPYTPPAPQPQLYVNMPGPHVLVPVQSPKPAGTGLGARVFLAIVSLFFVFGMFMVALALSDSYNSAVSVLAILLALLFAVVAVIINVIVNRRR